MSLRTEYEDRPINNRSRVSNGKSLFAQDVDMRSAWARRARDLIGLHLSDLGGFDATSEAERSIIRRAAVLTVELERLEAKFAVAGEANAAEIELYQRVSNSLRRLLESVGIQRRPRDVSPPPLSQYLRSQARTASVSGEG